MTIEPPASPAIDLDHLRTWVGKEQLKFDTISVRMTEMFNSIFDDDVTVSVGDRAPVGIFWCLSPDIAPIGRSGPDGHPPRGGFLPPVPLPRRMWAGGELTFHGHFHVGDEVSRRSVVEDITVKAGRTGSLVFVTLRHDYRTSRELVLSERQDIVYRQEASSTAASTPPAEVKRPVPPDFIRTVVPTPQLLFRYSAATFNSHRIHYDAPYATNEENYPGLVVHGPLQATHLLRLSVEQGGGAFPAVFSFRSFQPLIVGEPFTANVSLDERTQSLWIASACGLTTMDATASAPMIAELR